jgi:putative ABC transport system permease protein
MLSVAFRLAFRELRRNLMRSMLTMLGIIIGVSAVIVLMTLGSGATQQVTQQISSLGSNMLIITVGKRMGTGQSSVAPSFKVADAEAIAGEVPDLVAVAPQAAASSTAIFANENWGTSVTGSTEQFFAVNNRQIVEGRIFASSEVRSGAAVCIIGETVRGKLFGAQNPIGTRIRLHKLSCEIIGLLNVKGQAGMGSDQDDMVVMPLRTFQRRIAGNDDVRMIQVSARDGVSTDDVKLHVACAPSFISRRRR